MRTFAVVACVVLLAGCQSKPVKPPKVVTVTVEKIVSVPAELTMPCDKPVPASNTVGEAVRVAKLSLLSLDECSGRMTRIRELAP